MRIFGHVVARNEADRYLAEVLEWHGGFLDGIHVYDDASTDGSVELARSLGASVASRHPSVPPFLEHESAFRQAAWRSMERVLQPVHGEDWILLFDADEFFVSWNGAGRGERMALEWAIALGLGSNGALLRIHEIFAVHDGIPQRRTDGFWGDIANVRLVRYLNGGEFRVKKMGGGSAPDYCDSPVDLTGMNFGFAHFGYADEDDRREKYNRYTSIAGNGHNPKHIQSILTEPTLEPLELERSLP